MVRTYVRGEHGDLKMLHSSKTDSTTAHKMCLGYPKRPRSLYNSIVDRRYAMRKFDFFLCAPVSKWSHTIKIGYAERWILSILRAPPCREFDADGKGVGCVIDYMTISEDTDI